MTPDDASEARSLAFDHGGFLAGGLATAIALPHGLALAALLGLPPAAGVLPALLGSMALAGLRGPVLLAGTGTICVPFLAPVVADGGAPALLTATATAVLAFVVVLGLWTPQRRALPTWACRAFLAGVGLDLISRQARIVLHSDAPLSVALVSTCGLAAALLVQRSSRAAFAAPAALLCGWTLAVWLSLPSGTAPTARPSHLPFTGLYAWATLPSTEQLSRWLILGAAFGAVLAAFHRIVIEGISGAAATPRGDDSRGHIGRRLALASVAGLLLGTPPATVMPARTLVARSLGASPRSTHLWHIGLLALALGALGSQRSLPVGALTPVVAWAGLRLIEPETAQATVRQLGLRQAVVALGIVVSLPLLGPLPAVVLLAAVALSTPVFGSLGRRSPAPPATLGADQVAARLP